MNVHRVWKTDKIEKHGEMLEENRREHARRESTEREGENK